MNYCNKGRELLLDLKRADWLPPYDDEGVRSIISEMGTIHSKMSDLVAESTEGAFENATRVSITYYHQCLARNRRYLNSYLNHRISKVRPIRWETGTVLPDKISHDTLSAREKEYFTKYNEILTEYNDSMNVDLGADMEPPKDLLIEIRVLQDCGTIMTENGPVSLNKGSTNFLRRVEVEQLVRDGKVEHVENDDQF